MDKIKIPDEGSSIETVDLGVELPVAKWSYWPKVIAKYRIMSYLLEPNSARFQLRIQSKLSLDAQLRMRIELGKSPKRNTKLKLEGLLQRESISLDNVKTLRAILDSQSVDQYKKLFSISKKGDPKRKKIQNIITTGMITLAIYQSYLASKDPKNKNRKISSKKNDAADLLNQEYKNQKVIFLTNNSSRKRWDKWKSVAHFCAALCILWDVKTAESIDKTHLEKWHKKFARFLALSLFFQDFLTTAPAAHHSKATVAPDELWFLPDKLGIEPKTPNYEVISREQLYLEPL